MKMTVSDVVVNEFYHVSSQEVKPVLSVIFFSTFFPQSESYLVSSDVSALQPQAATPTGVFRVAVCLVVVTWDSVCCGGWHG